MGINHLEASYRFYSGMRIFYHCGLGDAVDIFLAGITVPSFLVRLCSDECERLTTIWASCLSFFLEHGGYAGFQEIVLPEIANMTILHSSHLRHDPRFIPRTCQDREKGQCDVSRNGFDPFESILEHFCCLVFTLR